MGGYFKKQREKKLDEMQQDQRRLRLFLLPRLDQIDSGVMLSAIVSGEEDEQRYSAVVKGCSSECKDQTDATYVACHIP